jgi:hypothetical protein
VLWRAVSVANRAGECPPAGGGRRRQDSQKSGEGALTFHGRHNDGSCRATGCPHCFSHSLFLCLSSVSRERRRETLVSEPSATRGPPSRSPSHRDSALAPKSYFFELNTEHDRSKAPRGKEMKSREGRTARSGLIPWLRSKPKRADQKKIRLSRGDLLRKRQNVMFTWWERTRKPR